MSLTESIRHAVESNRLPRVWTTQHLLDCPELAEAFGEATLRTDPANRSISPCGTEAGNPVKTGKAAPAYTRFQPANNDRPRKPLWFCLQDHNELEDPQNYHDAFPLAWLAGETRAVPMAENPNADIEARFARVLGLLDAKRYADALDSLADVVRRGIGDNDLTPRVHWGVLFWLAGRTFRALGMLDRSFWAFDHALCWCQEHPPQGNWLFQNTAGLLDLNDAVHLLGFEVTKARHALVIEQALRDRTLDHHELRALARNYWACPTTKKFDFLGVLAHVLKDDSLKQEIIQGMRDADLPESDIRFVANGDYVILADSSAKSVMTPGNPSWMPGVYYPPVNDKSEGTYNLDKLAEDLDTAYRVVLSSSFIARFQFVKWLGHGYFGSTMLAWDRKTFEQVAVKRLNVRIDSDADAVRFLATAATLPELDDEVGIAEVLGFGIDDSFVTIKQPYVVTAFVPGATLRQVLREHPTLSLAYRFAWMLMLTEGIANLQRLGAWQRDFKPENIYISSAGPFPEEPTEKQIEKLGRLEIGDVGSAMLFEGLPSDRQPFGSNASVAYFAPEQFPPRHQRTVRSEVYSLGLLLHEILLGFHPFWSPGKPVDEAVLGRMQAGVKFESPPPLFQVIARCLAWEPADRYASADDVTDALVAALKV